MKRKASKVSASPNALSWANWIGCLLALAIVFGPESSPAQGNPVMVGQWPGYARGPARTVVVRGNYAYVGGDAGGLIILNIRNPAAPVRVGGYGSGRAGGGAGVGNSQG